MSSLATEHGSLWVRTFGDGVAPVVALHGFTLHGAMFEAFAKELGLTVAAPDLPGHGRTEIDPINMDTAVAAVSTLLGKASEPPLLLGYSQGARVALQVAIRHPELMSALVLVAGSPGLNARAHKLRTVADDGLASRIQQIGTKRFIDEWLANPLTATGQLPMEVRDADRRIRLENKAEGLAAALRGYGQASVPESHAQIAVLPMPVGFIAGLRDTKYSELAVEMAKLRGEQPLLVGNAGHNLILETPAQVADAVRIQLDRQNR